MQSIYVKSITRETVVASDANEISYSEIKKYKDRKDLIESSSSFFKKDTGAVEMVRLFAVEDGARKQYAAVNKMQYEDDVEMEIKVALPMDKKLRNEFKKNFNETSRNENQIVRIFISTNVGGRDTLEKDGWVNKDWGMASVYKIDTENELPEWFQAKRDIFVIKEILKHKGKGDSTEYLIRWEGYNKHWDTWEPRINILGKDIIEKYEAMKWLQCDEFDDDVSYTNSDQSTSDEISWSHASDNVTSQLEESVQIKTLNGCDSKLRDLRLQTASLKKAYHQAKQDMYKSMKNAINELEVASRVFGQLMHPQNAVSSAESKKRLRCDVGIVIDNLRSGLNKQFKI